MNPILKLRKELHQNPELSGQEEGTSGRIKDFIGEHEDVTVISKLGGHGLAMVYQFSESGPVVMLRCELDALPIEEVNHFDHQSICQGISHACGHDGHMAIIAGMILWLKEQSFSRGKVILLFQPAEETGKGAFAVLQDPRFGDLKPDYIFAFHNIPGEPLHEIIKVEGNFSTTVQSVSIELRGIQSHASEPEKGINPAKAMAEIVNEFSAFDFPNIQAENFAVLTPVFSEMGSRNYGISAGRGEIHYTIRTGSVKQMEHLKSKLLNILQHFAERHGLQCTTTWFDYFPATENDVECNDLIRLAAEHCDLKISERSYGFKFGEDFGWFTQNYKAAMFGIGAGENCPALHKENYDFPDELLETGSGMFQHIIYQLLKDREGRL